MSANTLLKARHIQSQKKVKLLTSSDGLTAEELVATNLSREGNGCALKTPDEPLLLLVWGAGGLRGLVP